MNESWKKFLTDAGAEFDGAGVVSFGNPVRETQVAITGNVVCDLSHVGVIAVRGADAATFLQGQFTNDVTKVDATHSQLNAFCSPKGRMLVSFRLYRSGDAFYLRMPRAMLADTLKRLRMFVLRSKVTLEDASESTPRIGVSGPEVEAELRQAVGAVPAQADDVLQRDSLTVIRLPGLHPRFEITGDADALQRLWTAMDVRAAPVGAAAWGLLDIRAGVPTVYPATVDAFVPQMVNLQLIHGVSFTKGCYTGQEVVARMQYLGKLKRRMYLAHVDTDAAPQPGDELFSPDAETGQGTGKIVDAQPAPDGGYDVLAVVHIPSVEADNVRLKDADGPRLVFSDLPYSFEPADSQRRA